MQEGELAHGELSGYGRYRYPTGSVHIGRFVAGKRISTGGYSSSAQAEERDVAYYAGEWRNDLQHGWGAQVSHDLRLHVGEFEDGLAHGAGIVTHADRRVESAAWWRGVLQQPS